MGKGIDFSSFGGNNGAPMSYHGKKSENRVNFITATSQTEGILAQIEKLYKSQAETIAQLIRQGKEKGQVQEMMNEINDKILSQYTDEQVNEILKFVIIILAQ